MFQIIGLRQVMLKLMKCFASWQPQTYAHVIMRANVLKSYGGWGWGECALELFCHAPGKII